MDMLNRLPVIVKPHAPFLAWCQQDDPSGIAEAVCARMRDEPTVYLLPDCETLEAQQLVLDEYWPDLFEATLESWLTEPSMWPAGRTRAMFDEWFEVQLCSSVHDLDLDEPLEAIA